MMKHMDVWESSLHISDLCQLSDLLLFSCAFALHLLCTRDNVRNSKQKQKAGNCNAPLSTSVLAAMLIVLLMEMTSSAMDVLCFLLLSFGSTHRLLQQQRHPQWKKQYQAAQGLPVKAEGLFSSLIKWSLWIRTPRTDKILNLYFFA